MKEKGEKKNGSHVLEGEGVLYPIPQKVKDKMAAEGALKPLLA